MKTNLSYLEEESNNISLEQIEYIAIVTDRYEQEMRKAISNVQYELDKANTPYLGLDLVTNVVENSLTTINLTKKE